MLTVTPVTIKKREKKEYIKFDENKRAVASIEAFSKGYTLTPCATRTMEMGLRTKTDVDIMRNGYKLVSIKQIKVIS